MARKRRIILRRRMRLPLGAFHVVNRGARKLKVFRDDRDRSYFVHLMGRFALKHRITIIAWCLMPNHFHIELLADGPAMCRFMHDLQGTYARAFNKRHKTSGCVFQGRFRCTAIRSPEGLAYVSRYIHANPRDLGIRPVDYRWSSCRSYLGSASIPKWLDPTQVLAVTRREGYSDRESYRRYLAEAPIKKRPIKAEPNEPSDFEMEFVRHLEERLTKAMLHLVLKKGPISIRSLVCWVGRECYRIPARILRLFYGYSSDKAVHVAVSRLKFRLRGGLGLTEILNACP